MKLSRRAFLRYSALVGAGLVMPPQQLRQPPQQLRQRSQQLRQPPQQLRQRSQQLRLRSRHARAAQQASTPSLDAASIPKYVTDLLIPPAMPQAKKPKFAGPKNFDYYEIGVRQFDQQILPPSMPMTTVWGYGSVQHPETFHYPSFTIEAQYNKAARVKWINELVDSSGGYLPHLLAVDPTLHWANPEGGEAGRDTRPDFDDTPGAYTGPAPIVTHVHGAHVTEESDGYPEAWFLPNANNIPAGYATTGTFYDYNKPKAEALLGQTWEPGSAVFQYPNDQRATTLWYHDHTLGMTRLNVYAGPAGFYLIRGGPDDLPGNRLPEPYPSGSNRENGKVYEIAMAIQDRSFNEDGSLFFPDSREFFDEYEGPYLPDTEVSPIWNPEFFGNTMLVNGNTWPKLTVEPRRYRFRLLNGCNARFLILKLAVDAPDSEDSLPFWQIGSEGGFLPAPVQLDQVLLALAERADVIVDFTGLAEGTEVYLTNVGPDEPYSGGEFDPANPDTTGQVMKFVVGKLLSKDKSTPPHQLTLPAVQALSPTNTRQVSLNELGFETEEFEGPIAALLGTMNGNAPNPLLWMDTITEDPDLGAVETWEIYNFTADAHPIHVHQVMFQVVNRQSFEGEEAVESLGAARLPESWESGWKDTVIAYPGEITRIRMEFDLPGLYVWHCHIIDHEDNEMMRPYHVGPIPPDSPLNDNSM